MSRAIDEGSKVEVNQEKEGKKKRNSRKSQPSNFKT